MFTSMRVWYYDIDKFIYFGVLQDMDDKEGLAHQKEMLQKRLGLDVAGGLGVSSDDLFREEDLIVNKERESIQSTSQVYLSSNK